MDRATSRSPNRQIAPVTGSAYWTNPFSNTDLSDITPLPHFPPLPPLPPPPPFPSITDELLNQIRLETKSDRDEDTLTPDFGFEPPPISGSGNSDTDFEKTPSLRSSSQPEVRQTSDRSPPGEPNLDSGRSGRIHTERQKLSPSQPAAGSKARKWEYIRHYMGRETKFEYEYDQGGRLVADSGYKGIKIEIYLCNHDLYKGSGNIKDCGLTLWIQRAPRPADYRGDAAEGLCLYENCCVSKGRYINAGDVRVAFDESASQTPEHDPQTNAGYIHLKCLETHKQDHRQLFAELNFKVEGREPQPNDSLHRNPTTFGTIQEIVYIEDYLEQCRKDGEASPDGKATESGQLSSGIETQSQGQSKRARDIQRKLLELNGFHNVERSLDKKYAEVGGPTETASPTQGRPPVINPKATDTRRPKGREQTQRPDSSQDNDNFVGEEYQPGETQDYDVDEDMPVDPYHPQISDSMRRKPPAPRILPTPTLPAPTKERSRHPQKKQSNKAPPSKAPKSKGKVKDKEKIITAPYVGKGKRKKRMHLNARNEEVWEEYEDPWSPLESGSDDQPKKRTRVSKKEKDQAKALAAGARSVGRRKNKRQRVQLNDGEGDDDVNEDEGEDGDEGGDGDEGEDEDEIEEDHQAKKRRKRGESRG